MTDLNSIGRHLAEGVEQAILDQSAVTDDTERVSKQPIEIQRDSIARLVRLGKNFDREAAKTEIGRQCLQEHRELVDLLRRQDPGSLNGRY